MSLFLKLIIVCYIIRIVEPKNCIQIKTNACKFGYITEISFLFVCDFVLWCDCECLFLREYPKINVIWTDFNL